MSGFPGWGGDGFAYGGAVAFADEGDAIFERLAGAQGAADPQDSRFEGGRRGGGLHA